ncbi:MAG: hypothetical protein ACLTCI_02030 [[Clostridium] nexile]
MSEQIVDVLRTTKMQNEIWNISNSQLACCRAQGSGKTVLAVDIVKALKEQKAETSGKLVSQRNH